MSSKKRQAKIYQFDPMIYPRFLWVVTGGDYSDVKKWFLHYSGEEIEESDVSNMGGMCISVMSRQNQCLGILIWPRQTGLPTRACTALWNFLTSSD